jgi:class 3 adenylate cyclase
LARIEMTAMLDALNAERTALGAACAALGVGIAAGEVLLGPAGLPLAPRFACIGEPVQRAALLASVAPSQPHNILVDGPVQLALGPGVPSEAIKPTAATGGAARPVYGVKRG